MFVLISNVVYIFADKIHINKSPLRFSMIVKSTKVS